MTNMEKIQLCQEIVDQIQQESQRPVCRLHLSREPFGITDSHLGGVPYVPRDGQIPTDENGSQLWLCAQINFAQVPPMDGFPAQGILQFFLPDWDLDGGFGLLGEDPTAQDEWKIAWYPEVDGTVTMEECAAKMAVPWAEASKANMPRPASKFDLQDIETGNTSLWRCPNVPVKVSFQAVEQEGVNHEDFRFDTLFAAALKARLPDADPKEFRPYKLDNDTSEEWEALQKIYKQIEGGGCKIGGYPSYSQDDPREYDEDEGWAEFDTLLLQLYDDTYHYPQEAIGDMDLYLNGGPLNFIIRAEDLKNRDFSRVLAQWACT